MKRREIVHLLFCNSFEVPLIVQAVITEICLPFDAFQSTMGAGRRPGSGRPWFVVGQLRVPISDHGWHYACRIRISQQECISLSNVAKYTRIHSRVLKFFWWSSLLRKLLTYRYGDPVIWHFDWFHRLFLCAQQPTMVVQWTHGRVKDVRWQTCYCYYSLNYRDHIQVDINEKCAISRRSIWCIVFYFRRYNEKEEVFSQPGRLPGIRFLVDVRLLLHLAFGQTYQRRLHTWQTFHCHRGAVDFLGYSFCHGLLSLNDSCTGSEASTDD